MAFFLAGPTGSGKSAVAVELAQRFRGEIVNADAFQLYQGLETLTAQPTAEMRERVPHHLFGVVPPDEETNVAAYRERANGRIKKITATGHTPIVVGGSGLYLKALTHGISELPPTDQGLREALEGIPLSARLSWLDKLDPATGATVDRKNPRYVTRALEICLLAGKPASSLRDTWDRREKSPPVGVVLEWPRDELYRRINARTIEMFEDGAVEEVASSPPRSPTASKAIGFREIREHLSGLTGREETIAAVQQATRRYAKRQATWFRKESVLQSVCLEPGDGICSVATRIADLFPHVFRPAV